MANYAPARDTRPGTIVTVRWALILTCAYLILLGPGSGLPPWLGPLLVAAYLASNLVLGRMPTDQLSQGVMIGIAMLDTLFIAASLWVAGQLSVELLLLCLGVLVLAIAGLSLGIIAAVTIGMSIASLLVGWATGSERILESSVLLRVPFLLGAAMVFAQLVSSGKRAGAPKTAEVVSEGMGSHLAQQNDALRRCTAALNAGSVVDAREALQDAIFHNRQMAQRLGPGVVDAARNAA
ncbi:MAG: hypothetical protein SF182_09785 [Deltaproteobacteria bacterium]|nr:hypothetical protein [Deltaproteobacteria bacterium]